MTICSVYNCTVVADDIRIHHYKKPRTNAFQVAIDTTKMRIQLLQSPDTRGLNFAYHTELVARNITVKKGVPPTIGTCMPERTRYNMTYNDLVALLQDPYYDSPKRKGFRDWGEFCIMDGNTRWQLDTDQPQVNRTLAALVRAVGNYHPRILEGAKAALKNMTPFLKHGDRYVCMHYNPAYQRSVRWLVNRSLQKNGTGESVPTELLRNIFVVSQADIEAKKELEHALINKWGWQNDTFSVFNMYDLEGTWVDNYMDFLGDEFTRRGAIAKVLCGPGYAASYIGEWWSGFSWQLLARALADGPFADGYTVQIYGPARLQVDRQTERRTDEQTDRKNRWTDILMCVRTYRQTYGQTDRQTGSPPHTHARTHKHKHKHKYTQTQNAHTQTRRDRWR